MIAQMASSSSLLPPSIQVERDLIPLGMEIPQSSGERQHLLMTTISTYVRIIRQGARGDYRDPVSGGGGGGGGKMMTASL